MYLCGSVLEKLKLSFLGFLIVISFLSSSFSQTKPDYNMSLSNGIRLDDNTIEFDVLLKGINTNFYLTSYQCILRFNCEIANGGQLSFTYVDGSSQLINLPIYGIGVYNCDGEPKLTFASIAGNDLIAQSDIMIGKFRLSNTVAFSNVDPSISWNFDGLVSTILTGYVPPDTLNKFQDFTTPLFHTSNLKLDTDSQDPILPTEHQLSQNYPNPFNPNTNIRFALKSESDVKLVVYNLLGEMIKELVDNKIAAGNHEYTFNSDDLPSGIYLYRLEANNQTIGVKKMTLVK